MRRLALTINNAVRPIEGSQILMYKTKFRNYELNSATLKSPHTVLMRARSYRNPLNAFAKLSWRSFSALCAPSADHTKTYPYKSSRTLNISQLVCPYEDLDVGVQRLLSKTVIAASLTARKHAALATAPE